MHLARSDRNLISPCLSLDITGHFIKEIRSLKSIPNKVRF